MGRLTALGGIWEQLQCFLQRVLARAPVEWFRANAVLDGSHVVQNLVRGGQCVVLHFAACGSDSEPPCD
jgi:hypothetical protein